jgi:chemotaxis protein methyltransferase CheR
MTDAAFAAAGGLLARRVGLRLDPVLRHRLDRCIRESAAAHGLSLEVYESELVSSSALFQDLLNRVTVQETAFFRDPGQFAALSSRVLPQLREPVLIWSAGCATGQEAYSLAITLAESSVGEWRVLATDISTKALGRAAEGRYSEREMTGIPPGLLHRYFRRRGSEWAVEERLKAKVSYAHHNLKTDPPPYAPGAASVIFCRNVLIYFTPSDLLAVLDRLVPWLPRDGFLFLGFSESLWHVTERFRLVNLGEAFAYQLADSRSAGLTLSASPPPRVERFSESTATRAKGDTEGRAEEIAAADNAADRYAEVASLLAVGEAALGAGDARGAVVAFRKASYLDPDHPLAHFQLGLALDAAGEKEGGRRAYMASRSAIRRCDTVRVEAALEGFSLNALLDLLNRKIGTAR